MVSRSLQREGVLETLTHLNRLTGAGVGYRSFTEPYFDSCGIFKDAVISILATIARQERIRLSERVRAGLARARGRGKAARPAKKDRGHTITRGFNSGGRRCRQARNRTSPVVERDLLWKIHPHQMLRPDKEACLAERVLRL